MELRNKLTICRPCISENECFLNIYELNDWQGYVAAEVISNLLQCEAVIKELDIDCTSGDENKQPFKGFDSEESIEMEESGNVGEVEPADISIICLKDSHCYSNIFEEHLMNGCCVHEILNEVYDLDVAVGDGLPEFLCIQCVATINEFVLFSMKVQKGNLALTHLKQEMDRCNSAQELRKSEADHFQRDIHTQDEVIKSLTSEQSSANADPTTSNAEVITTDLIISECANKSDHLKDQVTETVDPLSQNAEVISDLTTSEITIKEESLEDEVIEFRTSNSSLSPVDPLSSNAEVITTDLNTSGIAIKNEPLELQLALSEKSARTQNPQSPEHKKLHSVSKGAVDRFSCIENISTNDESVRETSKNISFIVRVRPSSSASVDREEGTLSREKINTVILFKKNVGIGDEKVKEREEKKTEGDRAGGCRMSPEKEVGGETKKLECYHCGSMLTSKRSLRQHLILHGFGNSYECEICGKLCQSNSSLKMHVLTHTGPKPCKCVRCNKSFFQNGDLSRHMRIHTGSKPYKCAECGKSFRQKGHLTSHMRLHTGSKPYRCKECDESFSKNEDLNEHVCSHSDSKGYKCEECGKSYSRNSALKKHVKSHRGSKPYMCAECGKGFIHNCDFKKHMISHSGSKPYKCGECSKSYSRNSALKIHMRSHRDSKPYTCAECGKGYIQNSSLKTHMISHMGSKCF